MSRARGDSRNWTPGAVVDHFEVLGLLWSGCSGSNVYRARDTRLERDVVIKEEFFEGEERRRLFEREAKLLASLNHPNVAAIYSFEEIPGSSAAAASRHILVMEPVEGEVLSQRLKSGTIPMAEALSIARDIAAGLEAAHAKGIVHRDLKPGNVMLSADGRVKLLDFGLHCPTVTDAGTGTGVLGTAAYMSPEQVRGQRVDTRSDVWSFGVVLWELLTGKRLFSGQNTPNTLAAVLREPLDFRKLPLATPLFVRNLVERCLQRDADKRLADIGEARRGLAPAQTSTNVDPGEKELTVGADSPSV
jgi:serine/threonine protein kinase